MEINGLPAHPLLVHAAVVLLPLTAVAAILASVWPAAQRKLTFLVPLGAVGVAVLVPLVTRAGHDLEASLGASTPAIDKHAGYGDKVLTWAIALAATTVAQYIYLRMANPHRVVTVALSVVVITAAIGTLVIVLLAGDSGARAVWGR